MMSDQPTINWQHFEKILKHVKAGKSPLPNAEKMELSKACSNATLGWSSIENGNVLRPGADHPEWGLFFLSTTQGGAYSGKGMVLCYNHGQGAAYHFSICKHQPEELPGANHIRGWHPARCKLCGLDMSVDSGD